MVNAFARLWLLVAVLLAGCGVALPPDDQFLSEHDIAEDLADLTELPPVGDVPDVHDAADGLEVDSAVDATATSDADAVLDAADVADTPDADAADADTGADADVPDAATLPDGDAMDTAAPADTDAADAQDGQTDAAPDVPPPADASADASEVDGGAGSDGADADGTSDAAGDDAAGTDVAADDGAEPDTADDALDGFDAVADAAGDADAAGADVPAVCDPAQCPDDSNPCTTASCDGGGACVQLPNSATCDDANGCTSQDVCSGGSCGGTPAVCSDGDACTADTCPGTTGCVFTPLDGQACSDGSLCTIGDACSGATCMPGAVTTCDDNNACTQDACAPASGCSHTALDGQACSDGNVCTVDTCDPQIGCVHSAKCTDGDPCTLDVCSAIGTCAFPAALFQQTFGGTQYDMGVGIDRLADGFVLTGKSNSYGDGTENIALVRTDLAGNMLWTQWFGGSGYDGGIQVVARADGFAIGGYTTSKGAGSYDYWLIRTDLSGNLVWDKTYGDSAGDQTYGMMGLPDGYLLNGMGAGAVTGNPQAWLVRTDLNGGKIWDHAYAVGIWDQANSVTPTSDGGYAFAGGTYAVPGGKSDGWIVRIDAGGNQVWSRTYGGSDNDSGWGIVALSDGFVMAGNTASSGNGGTDLWLVRTDSLGNKLWERTFGGSDNDAGGPIALLSDGFALGGYTIVGGTNIGYLVRTNLDGLPAWQRTYDTANAGINRVLALPDGFATFGWTMSHGAGDDDFWLQRLDSFGNLSCGTCFGKTPQGCDDGNACTADACSAGGCTHPPMPDWTICGANQVCNGSGACAEVASSEGMTLIPGGIFWMGCNSAKDGGCGSDESPQHKVTLSSYYIDLTETTVASYKSCVDAGACSVPSATQPTTYATYPGLTNNPVNFVTWDQASAYCAWKGGRLPSEAEWEMAARGSCEKNGSASTDPACATAMRTYPWGEAAATCAYAVISNGTDGCGKNATAAVGSLPAGDSPYGLHDTAGNVWEWTRDSYDQAYYASSPQLDPYDNASITARVIRGGSHSDSAFSVHAAHRSPDPPSSADGLVGFRCARSMPVWTQCSGQPDGATCSDGNLCTSGDACKSGVCIPGGVPACSDGNTCTTDSCTAAVGCTWTNNTFVCSDGDLCTTGDVCSGGSCLAGVAATCNDNDPCAVDACVPATGQCSHSFSAAACQQWDRGAWDQSTWGP